MYLQSRLLLGVTNGHDRGADVEPASLDVADMSVPRWHVSQVPMKRD